MRKVGDPIICSHFLHSHWCIPMLNFEQKYCAWHIFHYLPLCQGKTCHSHKTNLIINTNIKIKQIGWKTYVAILEMSKSLMYVTPWPAQIFPTSTPWYSNNMELLLVNFFYFLRECNNCKIKNWDYQLLRKLKPNKNQVDFLEIINILLEKLAKKSEKMSPKMIKYC